MTQDVGTQLKARLREDLLVAMKARRSVEAQVIRTLVAALDNAEAPPLPADQTVYVQHAFGSGGAEVPRLQLHEADVRRILMAEIAEREQAAAGMTDLGQHERAAALREEAEVARRYLG